MTDNQKLSLGIAVIMGLIILCANFPAIRVVREKKSIDSKTLPTYRDDDNVKLLSAGCRTVKDHSRCTVKGHCVYINGAWSFVACPGDKTKSLTRLCYED